jgi:hypothetical protein
MEHRHSSWKAASASESKLFSAENLADFAAAFPAVPLGDVFLADRAQLVAHLSHITRQVRHTISPGKECHAKTMKSKKIRIFLLFIVLAFYPEKSGKTLR